MAITKLNSLAIPDDTIVEADLSYPLTSFSSTGIDDNATSTAITIDSDENVGIGILPSSTYGRLRVGDNNTDIAMDGNAKGQFHIDGNGFGFGIALNTDGAQIYTNSASRSIIFGTDETERARVDGSGNLLVGTTNANPTSAGVNDAGVELSNTGGVRSTVASNPAATFNRKTDDGAVVLIRKDGSTKANIGINSGDEPYFARSVGTTSGIKIANGALYPCQSDGTNHDDAQNLGLSNVRWANLYLSGGVYLGGTSGSNYISDYEEGTWTATLGFNGGDTGGLNYTNNTGKYTKIGDLVFVSVFITWNQNNFSASNGSLVLAGLPFQINSTNAYRGGLNITYNDNFTSFTNYGAAFRAESGTTQFMFNWANATDGSIDNTLQTHTAINSSGGIMITGVYPT